MNVVNGYPCRNCTDMDLAKRGVDPARPNDGPNGVYKADRVEASKASDKARDAAREGNDKPADRGPAVKLEGGLAEAARPPPPKSQGYIPGTVADLRA